MSAVLKLTEAQISALEIHVFDPVFDGERPRGLRMSDNRLEVDDVEVARAFLMQRVDAAAESPDPADNVNARSLMAIADALRKALRKPKTRRDAIITRKRKPATTHAAASAAAVEAAEAARDATDSVASPRIPIPPPPPGPLTGKSANPPKADAVGGADAAALADAAATDGATFVMASDRARAHVRTPPPKARKVGDVDVPDGVAVGAPCDLLIGTTRHRGAYVVAEADALVTSHNARTLAPDPRYPADVQERDYQRDPHERRKVADNAARLIPDYLVNNNPDSVNGPPVCVVLPTAPGEAAALVVMGGNSRAMSLRLAYDDGHARSYRAMLVERAGIFGLQPAQLESLRAPVLVRVVGDLAATRDVSRALNEAATLSKSATVDAVSAAARLSTTSLAILAEQIDPDATLDAFLGSQRARPLTAALMRDRVITAAEAPRLLVGGDLSEDGRDFVRRVLIASLIPDVVTIDRMRPSLRDLVARIAPAILDARAYGHDLGAALAVAIEDIADAEARGVDVDRLDAQVDLFGSATTARRRPPAALALRDLLQHPRDAVRALRTFARLARDNPAGQAALPGMYDEPRDAAALLALAIAAVRGSPA